MANREYSQGTASQSELTTQSNEFKAIPLRKAEIGHGTIIKRALPSREKRMIGAWCFLDHAGPVEFPAGDGLDIGPHPHIGLQTFTWMIDGTVMHMDSLGSEQLIRPKQVNLMTAGYGISHTEVAPVTETRMHTAQLWIALPDDQRNMPPRFDHYPVLPTLQKDGTCITILVGDYLGQSSPVEVYSALLALDIEAVDDVDVVLELNPQFEYGVLVLDHQAVINGHELTQENMLVIETTHDNLHLQMQKGSRILLIGGEPFDSEILLWWNLVARSTEEIKTARDQWINHDARFGDIPKYLGDRLVAPVMPEKMKASK